MSRLTEATTTLKKAVDWLSNQDKSPKILIKIARNMGDSLHGYPIIKHYRTLHPDAAIAFLTEQKYHNVHETNPDIDRLFLLPNGMNPQERLRLWDPIKKNPKIDIAVVPAIHPFGAVHPCNTWSWPNIADQYFANAGCPVVDGKPEPAGGRRLRVFLKQADHDWAEGYIKKHKIDRSKFWIIECHSYSTAPIWNRQKYAQLVKQLSESGHRCATIAGPREGIIAGSLDARGISFRQSVALFERCAGMLGCGSGLTMLAAAAERQPRIIEIGIPMSVAMSGCGYAPSKTWGNPSVQDIVTQVRNG